MVLRKERSTHLLQDRDFIEDHLLVTMRGSLWLADDLDRDLLSGVLVHTKVHSAKVAPSQDLHTARRGLRAPHTHTHSHTHVHTQVTRHTDTQAQAHMHITPLVPGQTHTGHGQTQLGAPCSEWRATMAAPRQPPRPHAPSPPGAHGPSQRLQKALHALHRRRHYAETGGHRWSREPCLHQRY